MDCERNVVRGVVDTRVFPREPQPRSWQKADETAGLTETSANLTASKRTVNRTNTHTQACARAQSPRRRKSLTIQRTSYLHYQPVPGFQSASLASPLGPRGRHLPDANEKIPLAEAYTFFSH